MYFHLSLTWFWNKPDIDISRPGVISSAIEIQFDLENKYGKWNQFLELKNVIFTKKKSYSVTYQKIILEEQSVSVTGTLF